jgi:excisionase family DNA binding protein
MSPFVFPQDGSVGLVVERHITINTAAAFTGYNPQYLRRLMRQGRLEGIKVGQLWLIDLDALESYLDAALTNDDRRSGPQKLNGS